MQQWEYPQELLRLEEPPHVMRRWTPEEEAQAAICKELRRQHEALMFLLRRANGSGPTTLRL